MIKIENIQYRNTIIPFNASIYDQDGFEGLYTPDNIVDEAKRLGYKSIVLDSMSQYKDALRLYERTGFKNTERYNDNLFADVFMKLDL